jgi:hypothetical protein
LNAGNYNSARRSVADTTFRPLWRNAAASLAPIVPPPGGSELWYDEVGIAFLREDAEERAKIQQVKAATINALVIAGYETTSVVRAVEAEDMSLLQHTGLFSVQLQPPTSVQQGAIEAEEPLAITGGQ